MPHLLSNLYIYYTFSLRNYKLINKLKLSKFKITNINIVDVINIDAPYTYKYNITYFFDEKYYNELAHAHHLFYRSTGRCTFSFVIEYDNILKQFLVKTCERNFNKNKDDYNYGFIRFIPIKDCLKDKSDFMRIFMGKSTILAILKKYFDLSSLYEILKDLAAEHMFNIAKRNKKYMIETEIRPEIPCCKFA